MLLGTVALLGVGCSTNAPSPQPTKPTTTTITPTSTTTNTSMQEKKKNLLIVNHLPDGSRIQSPLTITGSARGNWYFEASFPIELRNASNTLLAQSIAQAQGNWMTTNFVPFTSTLTFLAPTGTSGFLILKKDNPSGEPINDDQLIIPVVF